MYINFQQNWVSRSVKTVLTNIFAKKLQVAQIFNYTNNTFFKNQLLQTCTKCNMYIYANFQQNRVNRSVKTVHTNLFAKNCKLHKFATCNYNFEKSRLSDMHYPITDIQANFGINWLIRYQVTTKKSLTHTDGHTDVAYNNR